MVKGNPFAGNDKELLNSSAVRSDEWHEEPLDNSPGAQRVTASRAWEPLQVPAQQSAATQSLHNEVGPAAYPPPPELPLSAAATAVSPRSYSPGPPTYPQQQSFPAAPGPPYGSQPASAPAWTTTDHANDRLTYSSFEQSAGGSAAGKMRCGGLGEMWTIFLISWLLWPGWYVASVWYCLSPRIQADARQKLPFVLNCIMAIVFTLVWVGLATRAAWYGRQPVYCDPTTETCL